MDKKILYYMAFAIVLVSLAGLKLVPEYAEYLKTIGTMAFGFLFGLPIPTKGE